MAVGTTLALIEQGSKVPSSIHARIATSMARVIKNLHRFNRLYLDEADVMRRYGEQIVKKADYEGPVDVTSVADPMIFSETQRVAQAQAAVQRATAAPELYKLPAVERMFLKRMRVEDTDSILNDYYEAENTDAVDENVAMSLGRPVKAFPEQDHLAHLITASDLLHRSALRCVAAGGAGRDPGPDRAPARASGLPRPIHRLPEHRRRLRSRHRGREHPQVARGASPSSTAPQRWSRRSSLRWTRARPRSRSRRSCRRSAPSCRRPSRACRRWRLSWKPPHRKTRWPRRRRPRRHARDRRIRRRHKQGQDKLQIEGQKTQIAAAAEQRAAAKEQADAQAKAAEEQRLAEKDQTDALLTDKSIEQRADAAQIAAEVKLMTNREDNETALTITGMDAATSDKKHDSQVKTGTGINPGP